MQKLLTPKEVAELCQVSVTTLAIWRSQGRYNLPYIKVGKNVRYEERDVLDFLNSRRQGA